MIGRIARRLLQRASSSVSGQLRRAVIETLEQRQLLTVTGVSLSGASYATEGVSYTVHFSATSTGGSSALTGFSISWGDGSSPDSLPASASYDSHVYASPSTSSHTISATASDTYGGVSSSYTATTGVEVLPASLTVESASGYYTAGETYFGYIDSFFDGNASTPAADFTDNISWGDGTTSGGTVASTGGGTYTISASHVFASAGSHYGSVYVYDSYDGVSSSGSYAAYVSNAPIYTTSGSGAYTAGESQAGSLITFTDGNGGLSAANFTASVSWGDGTTTIAGTVVHESGTTYGVSATHDFADAGTYHGMVNVSDGLGDSATASYTATVTNAAINATSASGSYPTGEYEDRTVGTFTDGNLGLSAADFTASIAWGDGTTTAGTVTALGGGSYSVDAVQAYTAAGAYGGYVTVNDDLGVTSGASYSATVIDPGMEDAVAAAVSTSEIDLSWDTIVSDATAIEIDQSSDAGTTWTTLTSTLAASNTTYAVTGLADNTDYTYRIRAIRPGGDSAYTDPTDATTLADAAGLTATAVSTSQINLAWSLNTTGATGQSIYRSTDGGAYTLLASSLSATAVGYSDTSVAEGHDYSYEVQANFSSSNGSFSDPADAATFPVQNLNYAPTTTTNVLTWDNLSTVATAIEVDFSTNGTSFSALATGLSGSATTYTDTALTENTQYWYKVKITEPGGSTTTDVLDAWTLPNAPSGLGVTMSDGNADLSWTNNSESSVPFYIEQSTDDTNFAIIDETDAGATSYADSYPADGTSYYRVDAVNGNQTASNASGAASVSNTILAPSDLSAEAVSAAEVDLDWTNNSIAASGITILRSVNGGAYSTLTTLSDPTADAYADTGLSSGTNYAYEIEATQGGSASAACDSANDTTTPPTPTGLAVSVGASGTPGQYSELDLTWTAASGAAGYDIQREATGGTMQTVATVDGGATTSFADTGLWDGVSYTYQIDAFNNAGTSDASSSVTEMAPITAPAAPVVASIELSGTDAEIVWVNQAYNETSFLLERNDGSGWVTVAHPALGTDSYFDSDLPEEPKNYEYRLTAENAAGSASATTDTTKYASYGGSTVVSVREIQNATEQGPDGNAIEGFFAFIRDGDPTDSLAAGYSVDTSADDTAMPGHEYVELSNSVTFPEGQSVVLVPVTPYEINTVEGTKTVTVDVGSGDGYSVNPDSYVATVGIANSDGVTFSVGTPILTSGCDGVVPVTAVGADGRPKETTFTASSSDGDVLTAESGSITVGADGTAPVPVVGDDDGTSELEVEDGEGNECEAGEDVAPPTLTIVSYEPTSVDDELGDIHTGQVEEIKIKVTDANGKPVGPGTLVEASANSEAVTKHNFYLGSGTTNAEGIAIVPVTGLHVSTSNVVNPTITFSAGGGSVSHTFVVWAVQIVVPQDWATNVNDDTELQIIARDPITGKGINGVRLFGSKAPGFAGDTGNGTPSGVFTTMGGGHAFIMFHATKAGNYHLLINCSPLATGDVGTVVSFIIRPEGTP
jgi:hypothetical protein